MSYTLEDGSKMARRWFLDKPSGRAEREDDTLGVEER